MGQIFTPSQGEPDKGDSLDPRYLLSADYVEVRIALSAVSTIIEAPAIPYAIRSRFLMQSVQSLSDLVQAAKEHIKQGRLAEGRAELRDYLLHDNALLWLARVTEDPQEALAAAELAMKLAPESEVAQRAVAAIQQKPEGTPDGRAVISRAVALRTGMTLAQAHSVVWPFRGIQRSIGEVLADGSVTSKDLTWAAQNAHEAQIREAARTVLYHEILDIEPSNVAPTPTVVTCSRYSEWEERRTLFFFTALLTLVVVLWLALLVTWILFVFRVIDVSSIVTIVAFFGLAGPLLMLEPLVTRLEEEAEQYRVGRYGEEAAIEALRRHLDGRWTVFRNFVWRGTNWGDVDLLLVGPAGVWVLEIKTYSGKVRNIGDRWEKRGRWRWYALSKHPGRQARRNAARVHEYLRNQAAAVKWVQPAVIWSTNPDADGKASELEVTTPTTPVWHIDRLEQHLSELWQTKNRLTPEEIQHVVDALSETLAKP